MQKKLSQTIVVLVGAGLLALYQHFQQPANQQAPAKTPTAATGGTLQGSGNFQQAVARIRSSTNNPDAKFWTTIKGNIVKTLKDDREGDQHQRFLVEISSDITLLVAHNIDLAPRVPVREGEMVTISGEYVWNNRGGVMHWTHHDPKGRRGGWIEYAGKRYE
ncbi:MAG: DUF3465 domain-containing protein [Gammaproteobacteria bacterium]|nr:DUF3465 domain-containing protein [Gammaproteobacteria bacterium]MBU1722444.1 DUF3465 domain-containing protein [Gammaproteobacteria bacterium]MBU2004943.1 DUF3465 domain-containing protein [Gammaproteobacteria bacterium]